MINSFLKGLDKFQIAFHFATSIFILWKFCAATLHLKNINLILSKMENAICKTAEIAADFLVGF
jgi:hypothetical protein